MPQYYPICLETTDLPCLVVGGGNVAARKVRTLLEYGARVTVVTLEATDAIRKAAEQGRVALHLRAYETADLDGMRLIFVATNRPEVNQRITSEARERGILINVVDVPAQCDFIVPSIVRRGPLIVAVSTSGACPAYSKRLRRELEVQFDAAYGEFVEMLRELRREIIRRTEDYAASAEVLGRLFDEDLLELVRNAGREAAEARARALLDEWLG